MHGVMLFFHILGATIWTGGHIVLALIILPKALTESSTKILLDFESVYERIGMPALIMQIITGFYLALNIESNVLTWFDFDNKVTNVILIKLTLLTMTACLAINARFRVIPNLSKSNLALMGWHIRAVTIISILFVFVGVSFRTGWFY